jgi:hypothetical protein
MACTTAGPVRGFFERLPTWNFPLARFIIVAMSPLKAFLVSLTDCPAEDLPDALAIFADWLEETGHPEADRVRQLLGAGHGAAEVRDSLARLFVTPARGGLLIGMLTPSQRVRLWATAGAVTESRQAPPNSRRAARRGRRR